MEVNPKDPAGITSPYRLLVPALFHEEPPVKAGASRSRSRSSSRSSSDVGVQPQPGKLKRWNTFTRGKGKEKEREQGRNLADASIGERR